MTTPKPCLSDLDPKMLSAQQRRALKLLAQHRLYRRKGGYGRAPVSISLDIAASLTALGLAKLDYSGPAPHPALTGAGQTVLGVMKERQGRRG
jgi:hypothetical protein